ncbi:MAG TPA: hypothetical protein VGM05_24675 [Planctomycetaceae bacterium]|jgi:hypothetical protein
MFAADSLRSSFWKFKPSRAAGWCLVAAWLISVAVGLKWLMDFDMTPGAVGSPPANCPSAFVHGSSDARPLLIMFVHSNCPCSRAGLVELAGIAEANRETVDVCIYLRTSSRTSSGLETTSLWEQAAAVPGANLVSDPDGEVASRFQVQTSGHVLLYGAAGELLYSGGITASRGHGGDNPGRTAVLELLAGRRTAEPQHAVFGCPLFDPASPATIESSCPAQK